MNKEQEYIGGPFFKNIHSDDRVTPDLKECLYCYVNTTYPNEAFTSTESTRHSMNRTEFKIELQTISGDNIKQCPSCKRIYILSNPVSLL